MSSVTIVRTLAAAAVTVAVGLVLVTRIPGPSAGPGHLSVPSNPEPTQIATRPAGPTKASSSASTESAAAARLRELEQMSETFRNTTFLIAIRDAGFVCNELRGVYGGVNDSTTWTATCSEMLAYTVRVASNGGLGIEPVLQHIDGLPFTPTREPGNEVLLPAPGPP
jgi:hypothetical protein